MIRKVSAPAHGGHQGGAWKVAYADFVTAMMAFFLLLWILNAVEEEKLEGLADYFQPTLFKQQQVTGEGVLSGITMGEEGIFNSSNSPMLTVPTPLVGKDDPGRQEDVVDPSEIDVLDPSGYTATAIAVVDSTSGMETSEARKEEERLMDEIAETIVQAMRQVPDLEPLIPNVIFERTAEGLRIQIVDQEKKPMFPLGRADMFPETRDLMALVAAAVADLPNRISITGHTDSLPFSSEKNGYGNWDLSSDRANETRRVLVSSGISSDRIAEVSGVADRDPIMPEDTTHPMNRRISILLNYTSPGTAAAEGSSTDTPRVDRPERSGVSARPGDWPKGAVVVERAELDRLINGNLDIPGWVGFEVNIEN